MRERGWVLAGAVAVVLLLSSGAPARAAGEGAAYASTPVSYVGYEHSPAERSAADVTVTVLRDGAASPWFFAHQVWFESEQAGYVGLQTRGALDPSPAPPIGRVAIFSMFGACDARADDFDNRGCLSTDLAAFPGDGGFCRPMTDEQGRAAEGPGQQCLLPLSWQADRPYRLSVEAVGPNLWRGVVRDLVDGSTRVVGTIQVPSGWGALDGQSSHWIEGYGGRADSCSALEPAAAEWSAPRARGAVAVALGDARPAAGVAPSSRLLTVLSPVGTGGTPCLANARSMDDDHVVLSVVGPPPR